MQYFYGVLASSLVISAAWGGYEAGTAKLETTQAELRKFVAMEDNGGASGLSNRVAVEAALIRIRAEHELELRQLRADLQTCSRLQVAGSN